MLHCLEGWRSGIGSSLLRARGLKNVVSLKGGIRAWMTEGKTIERA